MAGVRENPLFHLEQLVDLLHLSTTRTKFTLDELTVEVCDLVLRKKYLLPQELWHHFHWMRNHLQEVLHMHTFLHNIISSYLHTIRRANAGAWQHEELEFPRSSSNNIMRLAEDFVLKESPNITTNTHCDQNIRESYAGFFEHNAALHHDWDSFGNLQKNNLHITVPNNHPAMSNSGERSMLERFVLNTPQPVYRSSCFPSDLHWTKTQQLDLSKPRPPLNRDETTAQQDGSMAQATLLPAQPQPLQGSSVQHQPQHQPLQFTPVHYQPLQGTPVHYQLLQGTPVLYQSQPLQGTSLHYQPQPLQGTPAHPQPLQGTPVHYQHQPQPLQSTPAHPQSLQGIPPHPQLLQGTPVHYQPQALQSTPAHPQPLQGTPAHPQPLQGTPAHPQPLLGTPAHLQPLQGTPAHPQSLQGIPVHSQPLQGSPTPPQPVQGSPTPPQPLQGSPTPPQPLQGSPNPPQPLQGSPTPPQPLQGSPTPSQPVQGSPTPPHPLHGSPTSPQPLQGSPTPPQPLQGSPTPPQPLQGSPTPPQPLQGIPTPPQPVQGNPTPPQPVQGSPTPPQPVQGSPTPPQPLHGSPTSQPLQGSPTLPQPLQGSPTLPQPLQDSPTPSRPLSGSLTQHQPLQGTVAHPEPLQGTPTPPQPLQGSLTHPQPLQGSLVFLSGTATSSKQGKDPGDGGPGEECLQTPRNQHLLHTVNIVNQKYTVECVEESKISPVEMILAQHDCYTEKTSSGMREHETGAIQKKPKNKLPSRPHIARDHKTATQEWEEWSDCDDLPCSVADRSLEPISSPFRNTHPLAYSHRLQSPSSSSEDMSTDDDNIIPVGALPSMELPLQQIPIPGHCEGVMLTHAKNPGHFHLLLMNSETRTADKFFEAMQERYSCDHEPLKVKELPIGSCWAARWADRCWYRVKVMANVCPARGKCGGGGRQERRVKVLLVDSGEEGEVAMRDVRFLHQEFTLLSCLAIPCLLAEVYPMNCWESDPWPESSTQAFVNLCGGFGSPLTAYFCQRCLNGSYSVILVHLDDGLVNLSMVTQGHGVSQLLSNLSGQAQDVEEVLEQLKHPPRKERSEVLYDDLAESWDPMYEAFVSGENTLHHNDECVETVLLGSRNTDAARLCKYYSVGHHCPRGEACRWEHTRLREDVTVKKELVLHGSLELCALPAEDSLLAVSVTSVVSPAHFYMHLHFGTKSLAAVGAENEPNTETELERLLSAMVEHYRGKRPSQGECLPAPGELLVLLETEEGNLHCSRVLALEVKERVGGLCQVKVFFIDVGYEEWVKEDQLHPLPPQFSFLPPHAVEGWLSGVPVPPGGWGPEAAELFRLMTAERSLVAHVAHVDRDFQRVGVVLFDTEGEENVNINEAVLEDLSLYPAKS